MCAVRYKPEVDLGDMHDPLPPFMPKHFCVKVPLYNLPRAPGGLHIISAEDYFAADLDP